MVCLRQFQRPDITVIYSFASLTMVICPPQSNSLSTAFHFCSASHPHPPPSLIHTLNQRLLLQSQMDTCYNWHTASTETLIPSTPETNTNNNTNSDNKTSNNGKKNVSYINTKCADGLNKRISENGFSDEVSVQVTQI